MISIENANLELALGELLARVLHIRTEIGESVYLTPRSAFARLEIFEAAAKAGLRPKREGDRFYENEEAKAAALARVLSIVGRAKNVVDRRHKVIHDAWGIMDETGEVFRAPLPPRENETHEPISTLRSLIRDLRQLISDTKELSTEFKQTPPTLVDVGQAGC